MPTHIKIVTKLDWPSFRNIAATIRKALKTQNVCTIHDWDSAAPGGRIIFIGTVDDPTLKRVESLAQKSQVVFYGTTEGLGRIRRRTLLKAKGLKIVAVSAFVRRMLREIGLPVAGVLHHGIDMDAKSVDDRFYARLRRRLGNRKILLAVSANHSRKGLDRLLEAYRIVESEIPSTTLILHSERNGYYDLEKQAKRLGVKGLWLTRRFGLAGQRELNALYKLCTVYVQPSFSEGFGLPILEAFRFDKPVVAVNAPPFNEIIRHRQTGVLIPLENVSWQNFNGSIDFKLHTYRPEDLAHAIVPSIRDNERLKEMRANVRREKWSWDARRLYPHLVNYFE